MNSCQLDSSTSAPPIVRLCPRLLVTSLAIASSSATDYLQYHRNQTSDRHHTHGRHDLVGRTTDEAAGRGGRAAADGPVGAVGNHAVATREDKVGAGQAGRVRGVDDDRPVAEEGAGALSGGEVEVEVAIYRAINMSVS